jgi:signal transduction histidine kinase
VVLILRDITQARQQDEMKRGVISTVSHQLKTPLTSVRMALYLLLEEKVGGLTPKQTELLLVAREDADRLHKIIEELLNIGHMESGKAQIDLRPVSPREIVLEMAEPYRSIARDRGITLALDLPAAMPEVWVDRARIAHVFSNLLTNALKYTSSGGCVTLSSREEGPFLRFAITDNGEGIPERYLSRIFEPFFRVPGQERSTGVGLGLAIAKDIVAAHGGTVGVESREGAGSTFFFSLRRADLSSTDRERA